MSVFHFLSFLPRTALVSAKLCLGFHQALLWFLPRTALDFATHCFGYSQASLPSLRSINIVFTEVHSGFYQALLLLSYEEDTLHLIYIYSIHCIRYGAERHYRDRKA